MADNKKSALLYCDLITTFEKLSNENAGLLIKHYLRYINDQNPKPPNELIDIVFEPIKQQLKRDLKKWEEKSKRNSLIAKEGWEKRKNANASSGNKNDAKNADTDKDTVIDKDTDINKIPSELEFLDYCKIIKGIDYKGLEFSLKAKYEAWKDNSWKDGHGVKIKNWKSKIKNTIPHLKSMPVSNNSTQTTIVNELK